MFNWIVNDTLQYLEPFDCVSTIIVEFLKMFTCMGGVLVV